MSDLLHLVPHPAPLVSGRYLKRRVRFLTDVRLDDGREVVAHCVNPGRMEGLLFEGARVYLLPAPPGKKRKLQWTWELVELEPPQIPGDGPEIIGANTVRPNDIIRACLEARALPGLKRWRQLVPEKRYGTNSRIDFWIEDAQGEHYVEVKNCHLVYPDRRAYFPDSVSERAAKHLEELATLAREGHRCTVLFTVQRRGARAMRPSDLHDPAFAAAAREAADAGVRFRAHEIRPTLEGYEVGRGIPVDLRPYDFERLRPHMVEGRKHGGWVRS